MLVCIWQVNRSASAGEFPLAGQVPASVVNLRLWMAGDMKANLKWITGRAVLEIAVFSLVVNILLLVQPIYLLQIYDRVLVSNSQDTLVYLTVIAVFALFVLGALEALRSVYAARVANRLDAALSSKALYASLHSPKGADGELTLVHDVNKVRNFLVSKTVFFLFDLPFTPLFLVVLYFVHPSLFYVTLAGAVLLIGVVIANQITTRRQLGAYNSAGNETLALAQSFMKNTDSVRALGMSGNAIERWGGRLAEGLAENDGFQVRNSVFAGLSRFIRLGLQVAIMGIGAYYVLAGEMTAGMIFAVSIISGRALQPLDQIIGAWRQIVTSVGSFRRLAKLAQSNIGEENASVTPDAPEGMIRAENLTYFMPGAPPGTEPVIKRLSFAIRPGECIGIIGPSGAGKTTLLRLLAGAARPSQGAVFYDAVDISSWEETDRGRHVGFLGQTIEFFPGTIAENIARLDPDLDEKAVTGAARLAGVADLITSRPNSYSTMVGPGGEQLSGGELQRIGLARALYGSPRLVFLDEPNSNLDEAGEVALLKALTEARKDGVTVVVVTHRQGILAICDRLMLLNRGAIEMFAEPREVASKLNALRNRAGKPGSVKSQGPGQRQGQGQAPAQGQAAGDAGIRKPAALGGYGLSATIQPGQAGPASGTGKSDAGNRGNGNGATRRGKGGEGSDD